MFRGYKYRLYPTPQQCQQIDAAIGVCRLVYNMALDIKIRAWKEQQKKVSAFDLCYQLVDLRKEFAWVAAIDSQALQSAVKKVDIAFKNFYNGNGYPKFKSRRNGGSFQCPNNARRVDWENSLLTIPKIKNIPIRLSRRFSGKIKTVTISKSSSGKYFASILVDEATIKPQPKPIVPETTMGIDVGIKSFVVTSDGRQFAANRKLKNNLQRLKVLSRRFSKKKKGSQNSKKARLCLAILHEKITNQRTDYIHHITTGLIRESQTETFVIEDLNVVGMLKNRKLSQAISDVSFGEFFRQLKYKCEWYGKNLVVIGRFEPSSKTCSTCGTINHELTLADRTWTCDNCRTTHDRDENAAINIKNIGLKQTIFKNYSGRGTSGEPVELPTLVGAVKQEISN